MYFALLSFKKDEKSTREYVKTSILDFIRKKKITNFTIIELLASTLTVKFASLYLLEVRLEIKIVKPGLLDTANVFLNLFMHIESQLKGP